MVYGYSYGLVLATLDLDLLSDCSKSRQAAARNSVRGLRNINVSMYIYTHADIYQFSKREREREREEKQKKTNTKRKTRTL